MIMDEKSNCKTDILEQIYVHEVYNRLGSTSLSQDTTAWPNVRKFLHRISNQHRYALVADIGCGNGKYLKLKTNLFTVGCDRSVQLCDLAQEKFSHVPIIIADNLYLPYRDNLFDAVLSIGVIHHLSTDQRRLQAVKECLRILKPNGGQLLIYTWALEQKRRQFSSQDVLVPCLTSHIRSDIIKHENPTEKPSSPSSSPHPTFSMIGSIQNLFQRWIKTSATSSQSTPSTPNLSQLSDENHFRVRPFPMSSYEPDSPTLNPSNQRFYHVFKHGELEMLIEEAAKSINGIQILHSYYDHGNWCVIVQKNIE